jgi:hypothetical protein
MWHSSFVLFDYNVYAKRQSVVHVCGFSGKEVVISVDLTIPHGSLVFVDAKLNITLPSFNPMLLGVKIHEKKPNDYTVSYKDNSSTYL